MHKIKSNNTFCITADQVKIMKTSSALNLATV